MSPKLIKLCLSIIILFSFPKVRAKDHYLIYCLILNKSGQVLRSFSGTRCLYYDDGSVISGGLDYLQMHDKNMDLLWRKKIHTHHIMRKSLDQKEVLVMTSTTKWDDKAKEHQRHDKLAIYNLKGQELRNFDYYKNQKALQAIVPPTISPIWRNEETGAFSKTTQVHFERSHANSFYEIDTNQAGKKISAFSKGNYIVNSADNFGAFILDRDLKRILWSTPFKQAQRHEILHDAKVLASGEIAFFLNQASSTHSELVKYDPLTKKMTTYLKGSPPEIFASVACCGSAQELSNGNILTTNDVNGGHVVEMNKKGEILWSFKNPHVDPKTKKSYPIQEVRAENLDHFLKNNKAL